VVFILGKIKKLRKYDDLMSYVENYYCTGTDNNADQPPKKKQKTTKTKESELADYEITETLGTGNFSVVKIAKKDNQKYAVKIIQKASDNIEIVLNEVNLLKSVNHPSIIKIRDFFEQPDSYFIAMEYVDGGELLEKTNSQSKIQRTRCPLTI